MVNPPYLDDEICEYCGIKWFNHRKNNQFVREGSIMSNSCPIFVRLKIDI